MRIFGVTAMVLLSVSGNLSGQSVTGWRGDGSGVFDSQHPPLHWSSRDNVAWRTKMSDRSNAQPVVVGDRIFVCSEPFELMCLKLADGEVLWQRSNSYRDVTSPEAWPAIEKELAQARGILERKAPVEERLKDLQAKRRAAPQDQRLANAIEQDTAQIATLDAELNKLPLARLYSLPITQRQYNGYTTATPTSDGEHLWAVFGNRVVVCYDMHGDRRWATVLPDLPQAMWGHSTSPLLIEDKLIVCIDAIVALDANTGKELWRTKYGQSWGSPVAARIGDETVIFMANGRMLRASDGKQVFRENSPLERASPVVADRTVFYVGLGGVAYDFPQQAGDKLELTERWRAETRGGLYTASPVVYDGLVYAVSSQHILNVLDADNGKTAYIKRLDLGSEPTWPSLCVAGKYLYVTNRDGTTLVLATGRTYKELGRNELDYVISSPIFHQNQMFLRTNEYLYCIGASNTP